MLSYSGDANCAVCSSPHVGSQVYLHRLTPNISTVCTLNGSNNELGEVDQLNNNLPIVPIEQRKGNISIGKKERQKVAKGLSPS